MSQYIPDIIGLIELSKRRRTILTYAFSLEVVKTVQHVGVLTAQSWPGEGGRLVTEVEYLEDRSLAEGLLNGKVFA